LKKQLTKADILNIDKFLAIRLQKRPEILEVKKHRRVPIGPDATLYFENIETIWWQIQEMLAIEKGGNAQLEDELTAYNPLIPQGHELVATFMIEIDDTLRRTTTLAKLGGIEKTIGVRFSGHHITACPEEDVERTNSEGKTSSIHFLRFPFNTQQIADFKTLGQDIILEATHPFYTHKTVLPEGIRAALSQDFMD